MESENTQPNQNLNPVPPALPVEQTAPTKTPPPAGKQKFPLAVTTGTLLFLLVAGSAAGFYAFKPQILKLVSKPTLTPKPTTTITQTPTISPTQPPVIRESYEEDTNIPGQKRFVSPKLALSFLYMPKPEQFTDSTTSVKEVEDKIYVYMNQNSNTTTKDDYTKGQWIQVFPKDKSQTLEDAIKQKFLTNYSEKDCFVSSKITQSKSVSYPSNYQTATISYPAPTDDSAPFWANADKCPQTYSETNGLAFFLMDKNNTDRFAFISIGQYLIYGDKTQGWQDTIQFLPQNLNTPPSGGPTPTPTTCQTNTDCPSESSCVSTGPLIAGQTPQKVCSQPGTANPL